MPILKRKNLKESEAIQKKSEEEAVAAAIKKQRRN
jgi:hypothetical protein